MESIGDYIYIFVMLVAILGGMFTNKKKRTDADAEAPPAFPDLSDILSQDDDDLVFVEREKTFEEIVAEKFQAMQSNFQEVESRIAFSSLEESAKGKNIDDLLLKIEDDDEEDTWLSDISLEDVNEAQKAFIYSEIMTRKYS